MKKRVLCAVLTVAMVISMVACGAADSAVEPDKDAAVEMMGEGETVSESAAEVGSSSDNLLKNGDFSNELVGWNTFISKGGSGVLTNKGGEGCVKISNSGKVNYAVQAYYDGFELKMGGVYEFSFDLSSTVARSAEARLQINGGDYHPYCQEFVDMTPDMSHYSFTFEAIESDPAPRLCFNFGTPDGMDADSLGEHEIRIDNVSLVLTDDSKISTEVAEVEVSDINLNQVGYLPKARKTFVARNIAGGNNSFDVVDESGNSVFSGNLDGELDAMAAGEKVYRGDFTEFNQPGTYKIKIGDNASFPFVIGDDVYDDLLKASFIFLYSQRCGVETDANIVGKFAHPECHMGDAVIYGTSEKKTVTGGWHDAGDYGRYVVPGAVTVADLFLTYEDCKDIWDSELGDNCGIPESGNGVPDILDEARFELEWMLQMQDDKTGGVYHKISCYEFPGFVMPQEEKEQLVLSPISSAATADFAAVMARSATVYSGIDSSFASTCKDAAIKAWKALAELPVGQGFHNPDDILTGEYPDMRDVDERYWAAVELYRAFGDKEYKTYCEDVIKQYVVHGYGWAQVNSYANLAYLAMPDSKKDQECVSLIKASINENADTIFQKVQSDGYRASLGNDYSWGSNMTIANNARMLLSNYAINSDKNYFDAAYDQMSYILGQNATSYCFVTGFGTLSPVNVHHRPSMATESVIPGMVAGGPNANMEDPFAKATLSAEPVAKRYADNNQSYSTNEVTIYWNSPFIYLLSYMMENNR